MSVINLPAEDQEVLAPEVTQADADSDDDGASPFFAVVNPDGTLARGLKATSAQRLAPGNYEVVFNRDVRTAAYVATIGLSGAVGAAAPGEITVVGRAGNPKGVFVTTHNSAGAPADAGFHLGVLRS
jgi:hypothetical protein